MVVCCRLIPPIISTRFAVVIPSWPKGMDKLSTPFPSTQPVVCKSLTARIPKASSVSASPSPAQKPSLSNAGSPAWAMSASRKIEDPELATKRTRAIDQAKGYSADWIEKRMRSIAIRDELTDEWKKTRRQRAARIRPAVASGRRAQATAPTADAPWPCPWPSALS